MRRLFVALALAVVLPAEAGINVWNEYVMLHQNAMTPTEFRFRIHCEPSGGGSVCGGSTVDVESAGISRPDFYGLQQAASSSVCTPTGVIGSPFDVQAGTLVPSFWGHPQVTPARKAGLCDLIDQWW